MSSKPGQEMWKLEPVSPSGTPPLDIEDDWLLLDEKPLVPTNDAAEPLMYDETPTRAQAATKLLEELDEWIKEEPFSDWLEEKIDLPIFEELPSPICGQNKPMVYPGILKIHHQQESISSSNNNNNNNNNNNTQSLLQEFETVLGDVEACHQVPQTCTTLTPPQSPPPNKILNIDTQLLVTLQPVMPLYEIAAGQQVTCGIGQEEKSLYLGQVGGQWNAENLPLAPMNNDVANELAVVDEFVRNYAADLSPSSPCTSTSAGSCASSEDSIDDPDWILDSNKKSYSPNKNRYKPYSRPSVEDKKVRKKEQNKNAATRYRQKKKQEIKEILGEERELADHNEQLQNKVKDLQREIGYLKGLMKDLFKAKGLLK